MRKGVFFDYGGVIADSFGAQFKLKVTASPEDQQTNPPLVPGVSAVLKTLHKNGFKLYIVSNTSSRNIEEFLTSHQLIDIFDKINGYEILRSKKSRVTDIIAEDDLQKNDCVFVTDTADDVYEAKAAGIKTIAVTWGYHAEKTLLESNPESIVKNPDELISEVNKLFS